MEIKSVENIKTLMRCVHEEKIESDGWANVSFKASVEDLSDIGFSTKTLSTYRLEFGVHYIVKSGASADEHEYQKRMAARAIHREIYGGIHKELHLMRYKIDSGTKDDVIEILDELLNKLGGNLNG